MSILSGLANPAGGMPEPDNAKDAESVLAGEPLTLGYRPSLPVSTFWDRAGSYVTTILPDVEAMMLHPHIFMPYSYYKSGIATCEFEVKANSAALKRDAESWINRFWERSLDSLQHSYDYGWNGYEVCYTWEDGKLVFDSLQDFFPLDVWVMTQDRQYRGVAVQNVQGAKGKVRLWGPQHWPAKGFWFAHNRRFHRWYGRSQLYGAWRPWRRLAFRDGMEEVVDGACYRMGYRGPEMRYPTDTFKRKGTNGSDVDYDAAREKAREFAENAKAGVSVALPNTRDEKGEYKWQINWPDHVMDVGPLVEVIKLHWHEMCWGIGVPPELIEASETGAGYSGRKIPMIGFFIGQRRNARNGVFAWKEQIGDPLAKWNYGEEAKFEVTAHVKVPDELNEDVKQAESQNGQPEPPRPVAFSLPPAKTLATELEESPTQEDTPNAPGWREIINEAPHLRIIGNSGSGKTTVAQGLASHMPGQFIVIDPVWQPGHWGGLPAVTVAEDGDYEPIRKAIAALLALMRQRGAELQQGRTDFPRLNILWDEVPDTIAEVGDPAGVLIRRLAQRGRHGNIHLIGIGQSDRVQAWGLEGYGDAAQNFATIYLGNKAIEKDKQLAGTERPGVLEFRGRQTPISLAGVLEESKRSIPADRVLRLPGVPMTSSPESNLGWTRQQTRTNGFPPNAKKELATGASGDISDDREFALFSRPAYLSAGLGAPPEVEDPHAEAILAQAVREFNKLADKAKAELVEAVRKAPPASAAMVARRVLTKHLPGLTRALSDTQLAAALAGMRQVAGRISPAEMRALYALSPASSEPPPESPWRPTAAAGAFGGEGIRFPIIDEAVRNLQERRLVSRADFDTLAGAAREQAFTVAGVETEATLGKINEAIAEAVEKGETHADFAKRIEEAVGEGTFLSPAHSETVFRTNVQSAYSNGQERVLSNPIINELFPYVARHAIHDDRVRPEHLAMEKLGIQGTNVYRRDDPVYRMFRAPWDFNCRCGDNPLSVHQAAELGIEEARKWLETGQKPQKPAWVQMPPFTPPADFRRGSA
ncbi:MAG: hypothetical protein KGL39_07980 [Patescibacteria group bacterium]|nr:hypothetical protein [Patescibacteria group bacterium]